MSYYTEQCRRVFNVARLALFSIQIFDFPKTDANIRAFLSIVIDQSLGWARQGWGGYIQPFEFQFIHPSFTPEQAIATMKPLTDWAVTVNATIIQQEVVSYVTWWNDFLRPVDNVSSGGRIAIGHLSHICA